MNYPLGITLKVISALLFTVMMTLIKTLNSAIPTGEVIFARSFFAILPILGYICWRIWRERSGVRLLPGIRAALHTDWPFRHVRRGVVGCVAMGSSFFALSLLPLSEAITIGYAAPLVTVLLAPLMLGEKVGIYRTTAVIAGFVGVLLVLSPHLFSSTADRGNGALLGAFVALLGACCTALAMIQIRAMTKSESTMAITFYFAISSTMLGLLSLPFGWVLPEPLTIAKLVIIGIIGGVAQIFMTGSYRHAPTSLIAPFDYTSLMWAVALGYLVFGEVPAPVTLAGAAVIVASGLYVIYRERKLGLERDKQRKAGAIPLA